MNILIVDDDELDAFQVRKTVETLLPGASVTCVQTADKALKLFGNNGHVKFDAIVIDRHLPGVDGDELARTLRRKKLTQGAVLIMLTSDVSDRSRALALASDFDAFLTKPVQTKRLHDVLTKRRLFWEKQDLPANLDLYRDFRRAVNSA